MDAWRPITDEEFLGLFAEQYGELNSDERSMFDRFRTGPWMAIIRRSDTAGDENVFVVAQAEGGVLYFDDVEYGFNISAIDNAGRILTPGGSQNTLKEAVGRWFPAPQ